MFQPIQKKGQAFKNGKVKKGGLSDNRKVSVFLRTLTFLSLKNSKFLFKKQPGQKINAYLKKENQKLIQLIHKLNGTTTNSTTIQICEKNCTIGMI